MRPRPASRVGHPEEGAGGRRLRTQGRLRLVGEVRDVQARAADQETDPAGLDRSFQLADERRSVQIRDVHLGALAREDDADAEPVVERKGDRRPEPVPVVELPRRDPVEDRRVLDRVGVADLVRAHEERLEVLVVVRTPDDPVERALAADAELDLDRPVGELDVGEDCSVAARDDALPAEVRRGWMLDGSPVPQLGIEGQDHGPTDVLEQALLERDAGSRGRQCRCGVGHPHRTTPSSGERGRSHPSLVGSLHLQR